MNEKHKTARSYRTNVIDDNAVISINLKWMAQIRSLFAKHQLEESAQLEELENKLKFYEKELNINPLSWRKRKKK